MMRKRLLTVIMAIGISIGLIASCHAADEKKIDFSLKLKPGQKYVVHDVWDMIGTRVQNEEDYSFHQFRDIKIDLQVLEVDKDGLITASATLHPVKIMTSGISDGSRSTNDSSLHNGANTFKSMLANALEGKSVKFTVNSKGEVTDEKELKTLPPMVMAQLGDVPPEISDLVLEEIESSVDEIFDICRELFGGYPTKPVAINERWADKPVKSDDVSGTVHTYSKITNCTDGILNVKVFQDVKPDKATDADDKKIFQLRLGGNASGFATYDETTGMMKKGQMKGTLKGQVLLRVGIIWREAPAIADIMHTIDINQIAQ